MEIKNIMTRNIVKVKDTDTLKNALDVMTSDVVNSAPVVNGKDELVGIVVKADIYRFLIEDGHYDTYPVEAVMTKKVITVDSNTDVVEVGRVLRNNDIFAVPIVEENKILGLVSVEDLLDYFLKNADYLTQK
ncbi:MULTISPECIES: CBS domain-containing protein [Clostridium]|uniref:CBS domain-containing protein n=1 Tax=Clostridium TaxID=1485 RepID=UPI0008262E23|nr:MULTISPECIES: CBS domain-containing protein [Clostridium]PJI07340.1 CBS domain-containing protein [Clostridium sp. CT7]